MKVITRRVLIPVQIAIVFFVIGSGILAQEIAVIPGCNNAEFDTVDLGPALILSCDFDGENQFEDTITIVDRNGDLDPTGDWADQIDDLHDLWLFDHEDDGTIDVAINFYLDAEDVIAEIYDAPRTDNGLRIELVDERQLEVGPTPRPLIIIRGHGGWWQAGDIFNFNLDIRVDGPIIAVFDAERITDLFETDGRPDYTLLIRDTDNSGKPDLDWRSVHYPDEIPATRIAPLIQQTYLTVNVRDSQAPLIPQLPWPYIGRRTIGFLSSSPLPTNSPPIQVIWEDRHIEFMSEMVTSRGNDAQYFVYSDNPLIPGEISQPNFEAPFAWYDLAEDQDRQPELAIRSLYATANDEYFLRGSFPYALSNIRYTWDQDNDGFWDYKFGLLDRYEMQEIVEIPEFELLLQMISYDELAGWVLERPWGFATFIATENGGVLGEGIYEWDPQSWSRELYATGRVNNPLPSDSDGNLRFDNLRFNITKDQGEPVESGMRGEYRFNERDVAQIYISPVDRRVHMRNATAGIWNIDNERKILYEDSDDDGYIDSWQYWVEDDLTQAMIHTRDYVVFSDETGVHINEVTLAPAIYETYPPSTHEEWLSLGDMLAPYSEDAPVESLRDIFDHLDGRQAIISQSDLLSAQDLEQQLRVSLRLATGSTISGDLPILKKVDVLAGGEYAITSNSGILTIERATAAQLTVLPEELSFEDPLVRLEPINVSLTIRNNGLGDANNTRVRFVMENREENEQYTMEELVLDIPGNSSIPLESVWKFRRSGTWDLIIEYGTDGAANTEATRQDLARSFITELQIARSPEQPISEYLTLGSEIGMSGLGIFIMLGAVGGLGILVMLLIFAQNKDAI